MKYLVQASEAPLSLSLQKAVQVLQRLVLPSMDRMIRMEERNQILAGGLPVGDRAFVFIIEAASNEELDEILTALPVWGSMKWQVIPLEPFALRAARDRAFVERFQDGVPGDST